MIWSGYDELDAVGLGYGFGVISVRCDAPAAVCGMALGPVALSRRAEVHWCDSVAIVLIVVCYQIRLGLERAGLTGRSQGPHAPPRGKACGVAMAYNRAMSNRC